MKQLKILICAYACEPGKGSEPGVGWNVVREVSKYQQIWVLTSNCHRQGLETQLARNPLPNLHIVYLDPLGWIIDWSHQRMGKQWGVYVHYYLWQIWAYFISRSLHKQISFDILHHVTYVRYSSPSLISLLPVPFIWGPVGGGESSPKSFWKDFSFRGKIYEVLRNLARWIEECDPLVHLTAQQTVLARATTEDTAKRLRQMGTKNVQVYSPLGLSQDEIAKLSNSVILDNSPIRFISVGRLLHWKGFHLGLAAFAQANLPNAEYWIVGEGTERKQLEILTQYLNISKQVKFLGNLFREHTWSKIQNCHVLVHPSLHESGGFVCLEAMAARRPVIYLDLGGPAVQVTEETGFKIKANTPDQVVSDIAKAMTYLATNPELRLLMGQAGQKRVRETFSWESKGKQLIQLYEEISTQNKSCLKLSYGSSDD
ncbi:glycosyltransferase family 4 protein [Nostoc sp.]|uniref:glycosyltransferase family 4 protein n=1 Tax=Nostoc sp. TaxID=1180 RepID=UPI002FF9A4AB